MLTNLETWPKVSPWNEVQRTYSEIISYVCVNVTVRCSNLNVPPLSKHQEFLFQKISELHNSGLGYRRISYWLKENGYKTPRGHEFKNTHVFSILKKRRLREERINKPYELTYGEWYVKKVKDV